MEPGYYVILGVDPSARAADVQEAYRRLAKAYHPDTSGEESADKFREIQEACDTLGTPTGAGAMMNAAALLSDSRGARPAFPVKTVDKSRHMVHSAIFRSSSASRWNWS
jgi:hypothetical protein